MPLYEYECDTCHHRFEVIQKFSDPLIATCPKCGGPVHKRLSSPAIQFKGTGWYITDYARAGKSDEGKSSAAAAARSESSKSSDGNSGSSSESKTETKTESGKSESGKSDSGKSETKTETKSESKPSTST